MILWFAISMYYFRLYTMKTNHIRRAYNVFLTGEKPIIEYHSKKGAADQQGGDPEYRFSRDAAQLILKTRTGWLWT